MKARSHKLTPLPLLAVAELAEKREARADLIARIRKAGPRSHIATRLQPRLNLITAQIVALEKGLRP